MNRKTVITSAVSAAALLVGVFFVGMFCLRSIYSYYYTQIDNSKYTLTHKGEKELFEYKLDCYDDNGDPKEIAFKTVRELRDNAFLKLKYTDHGGVVFWEELKWEELPENLQTIYKKPNR